MNPLVSVITPCYNAEEKIIKFLDSLLEQTYNNLEIIIIDNASVDNTKEVVLSYAKRFIKKGYKFIFLEEKKSGADNALNLGLKIFTGKYLIWPDCDDILLPDNIKEKVAFLENNNSYGMVFCNAKIKKNNQIVSSWNRRLTNQETLIVDVISANNIMFPGGIWMIRSKYFLELHPDRNIEIIGIGQNWQMLIPMVIKYPVGKINKFLFEYIVYDDSHSHKKRTYNEAREMFINQFWGLRLIIKNCKLKREQENRFLKVAINSVRLRMFENALNYSCHKECKKIYAKLNQNGKIRYTTKIKYLLYKIHILNLVKNLKKIKVKIC